MSLRLQRVRELLKRALSEIIRRELSIDKVGLITVHDVDVAPDLHSAAVFVGIVGSKEQKREAIKQLHKERKRFQGMVAHAVILKHTPVLHFQIDESVERGSRVLDIIEKLEDESPSS